MLNQLELPIFIAGQLPEMGRDLCRPGTPMTAYQSVQALTDYTKRMALQHNFKMVGKCMTVVGKCYEKGNNLVRNAVENVFVYAFSSMMCSCSNLVEWRIIQSYMPSDLYTLYMRQLQKSNC
jgi:hypothetical protein